ncbi:hypothetical protein [Microbacterium sp.]|uniref:hypothetical protein n=1 Tax=Microbacterium sp. TaxID=51671 RepID=UPI0028114F82|nr:hypothetical protein [Microbacterium sp.]
MITSRLSPLTLRSEPASREYGPDTAAPAPAWLIDATPGSAPLVKAFEAAREVAREAREANSKAVAAFRAASNPNAGSWEPHVDVEYDKWRQLKAAKGATETAVSRASRPVKIAWHALRDHLIETPEALAEANRIADDRLDDVVASLEALDSSLKTFAEADALVSHKYAYSEGLYRKALSTDLTKFSRDLRGLVAQAQKVGSA